jgi:hypothetical protein
MIAKAFVANRMGSGSSDLAGDFLLGSRSSSQVERGNDQEIKA